MTRNPHSLSVAPSPLFGPEAKPATVSVPPTRTVAGSFHQSSADGPGMAPADEPKLAGGGGDHAVANVTGLPEGA